MKRIIAIGCIVFLAVNAYSAPKLGIKKRSDGRIASKCTKNLTGGMKCTKYNPKGLVREIINYNSRGKAHGTYKKYYTAYSGADGYCKKKSVHNTTTSFLSKLSGDCKDKKKIKYIGSYRNGKKSGTWKTYDRDTGKLVKSKTY